MSGVTVTPYAPEHREAWDALVDASPNGTLMHTQRFLAYHPADRFDFDHRMAFDKGRLVAVLPMARGERHGRPWGLSPCGASFGGIVAAEPSSLKTEEIAHAFARSLAEDGYAGLSLILAPQCYGNGHGFDSVNYFLAKACQATLTDRGLNSVVPLAGRRPSSSFARNANKGSVGGFTVEEGQDIDRLYPILEHTIEGKHQGSITHTRDELHAIARNVGECMRIFLASRNGKAVAGLLCFENPSCAMIFYNCFLSDHAAERPLHFLFEHVIAHYQDRVPWMDLGLTDRLFVPTNRGLIQFKEGMGAIPMYRDYFDLALSSEGAS